MNEITLLPAIDTSAPSRPPCCCWTGSAPWMPSRARCETRVGARHALLLGMARATCPAGRHRADGPDHRRLAGMQGDCAASRCVRHAKLRHLQVPLPAH